MIAIIEDDPAQRFLYDRIMFKDIDVDYYCNLTEYLDTDIKYDTVVVDLFLPDAQGLDALNGVRKKSPARMVVITGLDWQFLRGSTIDAMMSKGVIEVFGKEKIMNTQYLQMVKKCIMGENYD